MISLDQGLPAIVLVPFAFALIALVAGRFVGRASGLLMVAAALWSFALTLWVGFSSESTPVSFHLQWIPALNVELGFRGDPFGLFFSALVSGIGALVGIYSLSYIPELAPNRLGRYYASLIAFMGAMLGIVLADDLILLFVFWEITSITSFLLIGFWYEEADARDGAMTALLVTALGGLALMAGFVLVGLATGSFSIGKLASDPALRTTLRASPLAVPALVLVLCGAFTKSAQVPFHFWLPAAMVAPTPISAYLHAATMVKAGVFLVGRLLPLFGDVPGWTILLTAFGVTTFVLGAFQALTETDLKRLLAQSTFSTLGLLMMIYGLGAADQDVLQILSHATYKGALFLVVGIVEHVTRTRDLRQLGGLRRELPVTFWVGAAGALSMAGLPPFLGFVAKESLYLTVLETPVLGSPPLRGLVLVLTIVANGCLFAAALRLLAGVFLGRRPAVTEHPPEPAHESHGETPGLWIPPAVLAALAVALGLLAASPVTDRIVSGLSSAPAAALHVSLWPAHAGPFLLSVATIALGAFLYRERAVAERLARTLGGVPSAQDLWDAFLELITRFAESFSRLWQSGSLRWYFSGTLVFFTALAVVALGRGGLSMADAVVDLRNVTWYGLALGALIVASALAVVRATTRLAAAIALTAVGFLVALTYVVYRSPDIVLTQILIETVSTIFILLVLFFMPAFRQGGLSATQVTWNGLVSGAVGLVMFLLVLLSTSPAFREPNNLSQDYLARSLTEAGGRNAVNVIIVDFRAMDTLGEITVLMVVGLCVYGLLRARRTI